MKTASLIFTLLFSGSLWAQVFVDGERLAYEFVRGTCVDFGQTFGQVYSESTLAKLSAFDQLYTGDINGIEGLWARKGLHAKTKMVLESGSIDRALNECYGDDQALKTIYVLNLILAESISTLPPVVVGTLGFGKLVTLGFKLVYKMGWRPAIAYLSKLNLVKASAVDSLAKAATAITGVGVIFGPPSADQYSNYREGIKHQREILNANIKWFDSFFDELPKLTNSKEDLKYKKIVVKELIATAHKILGNAALTSEERKTYQTRMDWLKKQ